MTFRQTCVISHNFKRGREAIKHNNAIWHKNAPEVRTRLDDIRAEQMKKIEQRQKETGDNDKH